MGFGVARSTVRAMPEPQDVGRVTGEIPTLLHIYSLQQLRITKFRESAWICFNEQSMERNYLKLIWILGFLVFASVSCWATAESLHLLLSTWPLIMCWAVTIGFFIIASLGTKMIVDSLNQNVYLDKRGWRLLFGLSLVVIFWLGFSMPTNTHTFFYRKVIDSKVSQDISLTQGYLNDIVNNVNNKNQAKLKKDKLNSDVDILLGELEAEIKNEANPGFGPKSKEILRKFASLLDVAKVEPLTYIGLSKQDREKLVDAYRNKIMILRDSKTATIEAGIISPNKKNIAEAKRDEENLSRVKTYIDNGTIDLNESRDIKGVCDKLNMGYNTISKNRDFVNFRTKEDEKTYTANHPVTKVDRMISVFDVWGDYMKGEYDGHGFIYWIILSMLVDIAAFIFFDLAFKMNEEE